MPERMGVVSALLQRRAGTSLALLGFALVAVGAADAARLLPVLRGGAPLDSPILSQAGLAMAVLGLTSLAFAPGSPRAALDLAAAREARPLLVGGGLVLVARLVAPAPDLPTLAALLVVGMAGACLAATGALLAVTSAAPEAPHL